MSGYQDEKTRARVLSANTTLKGVKMAVKQEVIKCSRCNKYKLEDDLYKLPTPKKTLLNQDPEPSFICKECLNSQR